MQDSISSSLAYEPVALSKVTRLHLHDVLVERLRNFVVEGSIPAGTKLNERELCNTLGISRTPLREAIKVLAAEGLVEITPNRGASVYRMSEAEIREMFELMSCLESFSGRLACERITEEEVVQIKAMHYVMLACHAKKDLPGYYKQNSLIHDHINQAARNAALRQVYLTTNRRLQALRFRSNFEAAKWDKAMAEHSDMIEALEARNGQRLSAILRQHLLEKRDAVLRVLASDGSPEATGQTKAL
ncbi:GntR family transcriptional regulator [Castellaniella sp. UC4442_H9]|jgi:DNA-binding GntR family transcriptional regulator|nr:GntR family transcriptional regulator [Castellaniella sp.]